MNQVGEKGNADRIRQHRGFLPPVDGFQRRVKIIGFVRFGKRSVFGTVPAVGGSYS